MLEIIAVFRFVIFYDMHEMILVFFNSFLIQTPVYVPALPEMMASLSLIIS